MYSKSNDGFGNNNRNIYTNRRADGTTDQLLNPVQAEMPTGPGGHWERLLIFLVGKTQNDHIELQIVSK